jgi:hypothetical protein
MCLLWKARQARLGIDDFGNKLRPTVTMTNGDPDALEEEVEHALEEDVVRDGPEERTPLLRGPRDGEDGKKKGILARVFGW